MAKNKNNKENNKHIALESTFGHNENYEYEVRGRQIILLKYVGSDVKVQIPSKIGKNRVVRIGKECFANNEKLRKISISDGIKFIGTGAFKNCTSLWEVKLPESLTDIQPEAFMNCVKLHKFQFNESLEFIGAHAFDNCKSLRYAILPYSLNLIGDYAFKNCTALNLVVIPYKHATVKKTSFNQCTRLKKIVSHLLIEKIIRQSISGKGNSKEKNKDDGKRKAD